MNNKELTPPDQTPHGGGTEVRTLSGDVSQEWTPEYVRQIGGHYSIRQQKDRAIADAHNAALAAEREDKEYYKTMFLEGNKRAIRAEQALAAEREKGRQLMESIETYTRKVKDERAGI